MSSNRTVSFPPRPQTFAQVLGAVRNGFGIVMISDEITAKVAFRFIRDGVRSDYVIREDLANAVQSSGKLGAAMKLADGSYLYKQTTRC